MLSYINVLKSLKRAKKIIKARDEEIERLKEDIKELKLDLEDTYKEMKNFRNCYRKKLNQVEDLENKLRKEK